MASQMTTESTNTHDQAQIRQLIVDQQSAICAKDVDQIMAYYTRDVIYFDCKPPFQTQSADALRRIWEEYFPYFPESFKTETRDLNIFVSGDLAFAHWLLRFTEMALDHPTIIPGCGSLLATNGNRVNGRLCMNIVPSPSSRTHIKLS